MHLSAVFARLSPWWPKQQPTSLCGGSPLPAMLRQTEQTQPSSERDSGGGGDTHRERQACSTAEQSTAAACPSPSATQEQRDACLLPPFHSHGVTLHSHTGFPLDDLLIMEECHQARGQHCHTGNLECFPSSWHAVFSFS